MRFESLRRELRVFVVKHEVEIIFLATAAEMPDYIRLHDVEERTKENNANLESYDN